MRKKKISMLLVMCLLVGVLTGFAGVLDVQAASKWKGYTKISTPEDLADIMNEPEGKYYLVKSIDLTSYGVWVPIENFTGILDGNGYAIKNLSGRGGLFGTVRGAVIRNLSLQNVQIVGSTQYVGGICNKAYGTTMENCAVSGNISITYPCGWDEVACLGGLVGYIGKEDEKETQITKCINLAELTNAAKRIRMGGIAGMVDDTAILENCINSGAVVDDCSTSAYAGGIIASASASVSNQVTIKNCHNIGKVASKEYAGGICGNSRVNYETSSKVQILNCLNTGEVTGALGGTGAVVGYVAAGFYTLNCVYLTDEKAGINAGIDWYGSGTTVGLNAKALNQSGLKKQKYYKGWDFEEIWGFKEGINNGSVILKSADVVNFYSLDKVKASVKSGTYNKAQTVELTAAEGAKIYYTTDGTKPTTKSMLYTKPIKVTKSTKIRVIAVLKGYKNSSAVTFTYTIK